MYDVSRFDGQSARKTLIEAGALFKCTKCDWKAAPASSGTAILKSVDSVPMDVDIPLVGTGKRRTSLESLNDDVQLIVMSYLDTSSLLIYSSAYDRIVKLIKDTNVRLPNS